MRRFVRVFGVIVFVYAGIMAVMGLQYLFDRGDLRKADQVIAQYKPKGSDRTLVSLMAERLGVPEERVVCASHLLSRYEGRVEVNCGVVPQGGSAASKSEFRFEVDVVSAKLRALNDGTKSLTEGVSR